jgi:hypothetical protein
MRQEAKESVANTSNQNVAGKIVAIEGRHSLWMYPLMMPELIYLLHKHELFQRYSNSVQTLRQNLKLMFSFLISLDLDPTLFKDHIRVNNEDVVNSITQSEFEAMDVLECSTIGRAFSITYRYRRVEFQKPISVDSFPKHESWNDSSTANNTP